VIEFGRHYRRAIKLLGLFALGKNERVGGRSRVTRGRDLVELSLPHENTVGSCKPTLIENWENIFITL
jgi:hypothetical protein